MLHQKLREKFPTAAPPVPAMGAKKLPAAAREAVETLIKNEARLAELGFSPGSYGEWSAQNCRVTLYAVLGEWELDIVLPNGSAVGCDVPFNKFHGRTKAEIVAARQGLKP
jgi:hypothetical protein